jgi:hypothetical protein
MEREQKKSGGWIVGYIVAVPATAKRAGAAGNMGGDAHATNTGCKPVLHKAHGTGPRANHVSPLRQARHGGQVQGKVFDSATLRSG